MNVRTLALIAAGFILFGVVVTIHVLLAQRGSLGRPRLCGYV